MILVTVLLQSTDCAMLWIHYEPLDQLLKHSKLYGNTVLSCIKSLIVEVLHRRSQQNSSSFVFVLFKFLVT